MIPLAISSLFLDGIAPAERQAIVGADRAVTWGDMVDLARSASEAMSALQGQRVGVAVRSIPESLAALAALERLQADAFLINGEGSRDEVAALSKELKLAAMVFPAPGSWEFVRLADSEPGSGAATVTILTSGSSGRPKAARHTWSSLSRPVRLSPDDPPPVWLLSYRIYLYAGLQVMLQCLLNHGTLVVADPGRRVDETARLLRDQRVTFASATPSFWRRLLLFADPELLRSTELRQITLGGEVCDQPLLDKLQDAFPAARLVHIYATTELGRCFSVTDGQAGFPATYLAAPSPDGVAMKVESDELHVRSANAMLGYDKLGADEGPSGGWFATGDLVERRGDRYYFVGRRSDVINVGGQKVHPVEVERVLRSIPEVADVKVFAKTSSIAGQLVACEIVPHPGHDPQAVRASVVERCNRELTAAQRPRLVRVVDEITLSDAGKTLRRPVS